MKVSLGLKAHSGWAALIVLGYDGEVYQILDRRRLDLVEPGEEWAKQPYHAAEELDLNEGRQIVKRGIDMARRLASQETRTVLMRLRNDGHKVAGCGLLVGGAMPDWSVDEILAVHFRMHKAEGCLFRDVLAQAAKKCDLKLVEVPEKLLAQRAEAALKRPLKDLMAMTVALGKSVGAPWGKDQKDAALAAMIALTK